MIAPARMMAPAKSFGRRAVAALVAVALVLGTSGCATVVAGGPDQVPVSTNPAGAYVYVNGSYVGQSPVVVDLDRERPGTIQIYLPGFRPIVMVRHKSLNGWFIASFLWLALIFPVIVDLATGNWQRFDDDAIAIGLTPDGGPPPNWYRQPAYPAVEGAPPAGYPPAPGQPPYPPVAAPPQPYPPVAAPPQPYPPPAPPQQQGPYQPQPPPVAPPPVQPR